MGGGAALRRRADAIAAAVRTEHDPARAAETLRCRRAPSFATVTQTLSRWLFVVTLVGFGVVFIVPRMVEFYRLSQSSEVTQGEVTETFPENHDTCKYRFVANGRSYEATGRHCGRAPIGGSVTIHFDPRDPTHSTNEDPHAAFINELVPFVLAILLGPMIAAFGARRGRPPAAG